MKPTNPLLTVITVLKDDPEGLLRTMNSLDQPPSPDIQWLVVDSSSDVQRVRTILTRSRWESDFFWTKPEGVFNAMNKGLAKASGDYVWFLNAGDTLHSSESLDIVLTLLRNKPFWAFGQVQFVSMEGRVTLPKVFDYEREKRRWFARGRFPPHQGTIARRQLVCELGGFNENYRVAADYELMLKLSKAADPVVSDAVWATFYEGGVSSTNWRRSLREFHHARRAVLKFSRAASVGESALTLKHYASRSLGQVKRRAKCL